MKQPRYVAVSLGALSLLGACSPTNDEPDGFKDLTSAGLDLTLELQELGGPTAWDQNPGGSLTYEGYAGFVRTPLGEIDEEQILGDPESYVEYISRVTLEADLDAPLVLGGRYYDFHNVDGPVEGELEIDAGNIFENSSGFLALSTDAIGSVGGEDVIINNIDGEFLGDNAEGAYGWMDGFIEAEPISGYFVAKR